MGINGYSDEELVDGPQNGWMGYYSLSQQGIEIDDFEAYIEANSPVTFTDPTVSIIHYDQLMMQQKEARRKHTWVLPRKVGKMV